MEYNWIEQNNWSRLEINENLSYLIRAIHSTDPEGFKIVLYSVTKHINERAEAMITPTGVMTILQAIEFSSNHYDLYFFNVADAKAKAEKNSRLEIMK